jgi:large subunit ribosomal protein L23
MAKKTETKLATSDVENKVENKIESKSSSLIISPRLTEKASNLSIQNVYTFNVKSEATKITIADEIKKTYKVTPIKITIVNHPRTATFSRGKLGYKSGFKKASVFLKKGDKINLV